MLAVGPAMDGEFPQPEPPPTGSVLYSLSPLQTPLCGSSVQDAMLHYPWWPTCSPSPYAAFSSESHPFVNSASCIVDQPCTDTSYGPAAAASSFLPKSGDFPQDSSYLDDLSNASIFSSSVDSLSDIADTHDFLPADSLSQVPTIWDVNTGPSAHDKLFLPSGSFPGLDNPVSSLSSTSVLGSYQSQSQPEEEDEAEEEEAEELGHTETYADYVPTKSKIGKQHPDRVVETSTLSSVPPPDITYTLALPASDSGALSALQLEAITYACQQHEVLLPGGQRAGFLIGDGAGVGKGRTVAGIILENFLRGRKKSLWFSVSNDLKYDAERDLRDIEAHGIAVHALSKIKYGDNTTSEGVLFATYSALIGESQAGGQHRTRIRQVLEWCGEAFDGVIVFDECHKAKNASSTKMGKAVLDLQNKLPLARVVYASATGASEPKNMIYMSRLGIWGEGTPFRTFDEFLHAIEKRGVGAMEIVAMDMKVSGMYIARQLSFSGVTFRIEEIPLDPAFEHVYNRAALLWAEALGVFQQAADCIGLESRKSLWGQFWSAHQRFFKYLCVAAKVHRLVELAREELARDKCVVIGLQSTGEARTREVLDEKDGQLDCFVSAAEGVFLSLIQKHFPSTKRKRERGAGGKRKRRPRGRGAKAPRLACEVTGVIRISDDSSTESDAGLDSDFHSSPESLVDDDVVIVDAIGLPADDRGPLCPLQRDPHGPGVLEHVERLKQDLLAKVRALGPQLPVNTLDELIDQLGGPERVAEMTGRKGRVVSRPDGTVAFESRAEQGLSIDHVNLREKERFMSGEKLVAIISEASSSGVSLQADRRVQNQRRRVHMTLELPWSADRAIQQFGRTHRSNQVSAPEYVFLISELAGERRFASIVAKRLESLGALTHGDRRATESRDLSKYNFENKYGARALSCVLNTILSQTENKVPLPLGYPGGGAAFFRDMKQGLLSVGIIGRESRSGGLDVEKDCSITKFLNRILGLEVHKQNTLFQYFSDTFDHLIEVDKKEGKYDMGILDLAPGIDEIYEESQQVFLAPGHPQDGQVVFYKCGPRAEVGRGVRQVAGAHGRARRLLPLLQGSRQQAELPAGGAEPRQALHRVQTQHRPAEPAGDLGEPAPEVPPGDGGGGQGALGEQLHLLADTLQPHGVEPALPAGAGGQGLRAGPAAAAPLHAVRGAAARVGPHRRRHGRRHQQQLPADRAPQDQGQEEASRHQDPRGLRAPRPAGAAADGRRREAQERAGPGLPRAAARAGPARAARGPRRGAGPHPQPAGRLPAALALRLPAAAPGPRPRRAAAGRARRPGRPRGARAAGLRHQLQGGAGGHAALPQLRAGRRARRPAGQRRGGGGGRRGPRAAERHPLQPPLPQLLGPAARSRRPSGEAYLCAAPHVYADAFSPHRGG
ncbi:protein strawberry notch homolog 2 isoform X1 [Equus caballus]|uniref:protein strawberry notch homolog 2 isoform X1 n=1 Tax=Equus caballus TaxID=9796 RepID=UPI000C9E05D0|nr:protein strawberry notch homolog 2 isoform X1 [Equus caballus]XP_023500086.1 protein strawberry notch homolog 2 isoform X1 [Equus caballus]XP_023500088.1 protein strawberry notch homolog 2 isoform X1 [Equus caballus]